MRLKSRYTSSLAVIATVGVLAACSSSGSPESATTSGNGAASGNPYRILVIVPLSGIVKATGTAYATSVKLAAHDLNGQGGILGRQITVDVADDRGDPNQALTELKDSIDSGTPPDAVYAGATSNETLAMLPLLSSKKIMNIGITNADALNDPAKYPYTFRPDPPNGAFAAYLASAMAAKGYRKVGLLASDDALGQSTSGREANALQEAGIATKTATFQQTDLDLSAPMSQLQSWGPDAVIFTSTVPATQTLALTAKQKVGLTVPLYGDLTASSNMYTTAGPAASRDVFTAGYAVALASTKQAQTPRLRAFIQEVNASSGGLNTYIINYTWPYDAVKLLQVAAKQADSTDPGKMKNALENLAPQPAGTFLSFENYKFSKTSHFNMSTVSGDFAIQPLGPQVDGQFHLPPAN